MEPRYFARPSQAGCIPAIDQRVPELCGAFGFAAAAGHGC